MQMLQSVTPVSSLLPATNKDYGKKVGDGLGSSVLAAPLNFVMRTHPEAPPIVERLSGEEWKVDAKSEVVQLLKKPNPFYNGRTLQMCTVLDLSFGEAFWLKLRNSSDQVVELWWAPRQLMEPKWPSGGSEYIERYDYHVGGKTVPIRPRDVVHFRFGLDPRNIRRGLSPLGALVREVAVDDEAAAFTSTILENLGVIGVVISPKEKGTADQKTIDEVKAFIKRNFTKDKRAEPLALGAPTDVNLLQYNMSGFNVAPIRDISEERVCAAMGLPAAVVGFGTGLHQTKVGATMKEMRQLAWTGGLIPLGEIMSDQIDMSLLPDFEPKAAERGEIRMRYDTSKVRALWEDTNEKHTRVREDYRAGLIDRATALRETGRAAADADIGVYYSGPKSDLPPATPAKPKPDNEEDDKDE